MSTQLPNSRTRLIDAIEGLSAAINDLPNIENPQLKAVITRGICVGAFNYIEEFIQQRWKEVCSEINRQTTHQFQLLDSKKQSQILIRQLDHTLKQNLSKTSNLKDATSTLFQLLTSLNGKPTLLLSETLFKPKGSNINLTELNNAFGILSCKHLKLFKSLGNQLTLPSTNGSGNQEDRSPLDCFEFLKDLRHSAAHNPNLQSESLLLNQQIDNKMLLFACCFDLIVTTIATKLIRSKSQNNNPFSSPKSSDFHNWRAIQLSEQRSDVLVYDFHPDTNQLQCITRQQIKSQTISVSSILERCNSPLLTHGEFLLTNGELSPKSGTRFVKNHMIQNIITDTLKRNVTNGDNDSYFYLFYDHDFKIIDWNFTGSLLT